MRQSPPPTPTAQSTSPRPKESSFLKSIGKELSSFGGFLGTSSTPSAKGSGAKQAAPTKPPMPESRRSHRPAPKTPGVEGTKEGSFPGVKLRSRETLLPPAQGSGTDLTEEDFDDLAGAKSSRVVVSLC